MYEGGCLCGKVRFRIAAEPTMSGRCCCQACQKLSGAGHTENIAFPKAAIDVTGETADYVWTADSGGAVTTSFCPICGSPLFARRTSMPGLKMVRAGALDDPGALYAADDGLCQAPPRLGAARRGPAGVRDHAADGRLTALPHDPHLADELRRALDGRAGIKEQAMFGGYCWLLNGNMLCGVEVRRFMFRVGKAQEAEALVRPGAESVVFSGRKMGGIVWVGADAALEEGLAGWIDLAAAFAGALPPKSTSGRLARRSQN
jgi:hypothetical protein